MTILTRRTFLGTAAASVAAAGLQAQTSTTAHVSMVLPAVAAGPPMPTDFLGLSYEKQQLKDPAFFSASNTGLIRQFHALSPGGVLRLGGGTGDFSWWKPTPDSPEPETPHGVTRGPLYYPVTAAAVSNLEGFLSAVGWSCIYGLNLGSGTPERAAQEAAYVAKALGPRLKFFQMGNEVDLWALVGRKPKTNWNPRIYLKEWMPFARAIAAAVPDAKFGMPDISNQHLDWLTEIAEILPAIENPPNIVCFTHHYYFGGPATNPEVNIPNLLSSETATKVQDMADIARAAACRMGIPLRLTEGNSCWQGGKPGVSDVFAAAMWSADYALHLAHNGYTGVNLHGGSGPSVANSVGGSLPGDALLHEEGYTPVQIASHPHPFYTPIASFGSEYVMEPVAYGLKFASLMSGGTFFENDLSGRFLAAGVDAAAYAAKMPGGEVRVAILNKDADRDLTVDLDCGSHRNGTVETTILRAPALDSRKAAITPGMPSGSFSNGRYTVSVQRATGMCLTFRA